MSDTRADSAHSRAEASVEATQGELEELRAIAAQRRCLDSRERETLAAARRNGATLDNIAKSLGISKQAVHQRLKNLGSLQLLLVGSWAQDLAGDFASRLG